MSGSSRSRHVVDAPHRQLIRFYECERCKDTKATLTSPIDVESNFSIPSILHSANYERTNLVPEGKRT
jgi:hypothetical protein